MAKICSDGPVAALRSMALRLDRLVVKLGEANVRLAEPDRQRVVILIDEFCSGKTSTASPRYCWSKAEIERCYLQLQPISQEMANDFRSWASEYREAEHQCNLLFRSRIAELVRRSPSEEL